MANPALGMNMTVSGNKGRSRVPSPPRTPRWRATSGDTDKAYPVDLTGDPLSVYIQATITNIIVSTRDG
ncbi:hypothetical protein GGTG_10495 [Gaeumannomyces tritici R3-111a-1]|uniref:Uncharacterized protein n=1 Tax=Gaeumannomyces tritici (strain R3-111a-1) TaxID=644352 RepID=J3PAG9_GAET3|nr:hypothetical protein GGTG_10495 [Gaeumannomyces tritici R3-111a-1]EJT71235.1 hypothetical protein GGTG_10495 [Gaeumannomyces tritici R3-111a-1]